MSEATIWARLREAGMTEAGAAGLMGNMSAESAMRADNAQDGMTSLSDEAYTLAVDNGTYLSFVGDCVGYGLCQWTFHTRKAALLAYALERGTSIGDEDMQVRFAVRELKSDFAALWSFLCRTDDWYAAAERICREYERPAVCNVVARAEAAWGYYDRFAGTDCAQMGTEGASSTASGPPSPEGEGFGARWTAAMPAMATLCQGFDGAQVLILQALLLAEGFIDGETSGLFDAKTRAAVLEYQAARCLDADGIVGKQTWAALLTPEKTGE